MSTINNRRLYKCADSVLYSNAGLIITAFEGDAAVTARLPAGSAAAARQFLEDAEEANAGQQNNTTELSGLTTAQNTALATIKLKSSLARDTAKKAFRGQTTKLREQFGVGERPQSLADITSLALRIHAGCTDTDNAAPLAAKGWTAADSTALETAILTVTGADTIQEARKATNKGDSMEFITLNNSLYEAVTAMQNACAIQYPGAGPVDVTARQLFRIGIFPPIVNDAVPTKPKKFRAVPQAAGSLQIFYDWNISARADNYLLTLRNKATGEVIQTYATAENNALITLTGTAPGTEIEAVIVARNELGPSPEAGPVTAVVP